MALTYNGKVTEAARTIADAATKLRDAIDLIREVRRYNSHLAIDWNGDPLPAYIAEEGGTLSGHKFSRAEVSNVIGNFNTILTLLDDEQSALAGILGNLDKLADAPK